MSKKQLDNKNGSNAKQGELIFEDNYEEMLEFYEDKLQKALASEKQFIASMSHEIRTPLNSIMGYLELLKSEELPMQARSFVDSADISAKHLFSLINDILDISKIEAGQLDLNENTLDLDDLLLDCSVIVSSRVHKEVFLNIELPRLDYLLVGDAMRIKQIFVNLLGNAAKFTNSGEIKLFLRGVDSFKNDKLTLTFVVEDSGVGIEKSKQEDLFKPFKQLHGAQFEGTGLGLYLTKALLEKMQGSISVESELGVGTKFTLTMQLKKGAKKEQPLELKGVKILLISDDESLDLLMEESSTLGATIRTVSPKRSGVAIYAEIERVLKGGFVPDLILIAQGEIREKAVNIVWLLRDLAPSSQIVAINAEGAIAEEVDKTARKPLFLSTLRGFLKERVTSKKQAVASYAEFKVLLVEDMELNAELAIEMFKRYFEIDLELARSAEEAIWRVKKEQFDLIFMDIQLPQMDGIEATKTIRKFDKTTPIVALSANAFKEDTDLAKAAGMNDYLTKPIVKERVANALELFLTKKETKQKVEDMGLKRKLLSFFEKEYSKEGAIKLSEIAQKSIIDELKNLKEILRSTSELEVIRVALHKLKGVLLNSGFLDIAKLVATKEEGLKKGVLPEVDLVDRLVTMLEIEKGVI